jgi:hypothetical protein
MSAFLWMALCFGGGLLCGSIATLLVEGRPQRRWRRWRENRAWRAQERRGGKRCRCGATMRQEYSEVSMGRCLHDFDPASVIYWRCDACERTCADRDGSGVDAGTIPAEEWCIHDAQGFVRELGAVKLLQIRGRGTVAQVPRTSPRFFEIGQRVDVQGRRFVISGIEYSSGAHGVLPGGGLVLRTEGA